jgi:hypothetical protein
VTPKERATAARLPLNFGMAFASAATESRRVGRGAGSSGLIAAAFGGFAFAFAFALPIAHALQALGLGPLENNIRITTF